MDNDRLVAQLVAIFPDHDVGKIFEIITDTQNTLHPLQINNLDLVIARCTESLLSIDPTTTDEPTDDNRKRKAEDQNRNVLPGVAGSKVSKIEEVIIQARNPNVIDPNKIVPEFELDVYVNHVKQMFPSVDLLWLRKEFLTQRYTMAAVIDYIVTKPGSVPKEKKPERPVKKSQSAKCAKHVNYFFDIVTCPDQTYTSVATRLFCEEFGRVRQMCLMKVLNFFNYHYAPSVKLIRDNLKQFENLRLMSGKVVPLQNFPAIDTGSRKRPYGVTINCSSRKRAFGQIDIPAELQAEIEWLNNHLDDDWTSNADAQNVTEDECQSLQRQALLEAARSNGELYECDICCDEYLFDEMKPCTEGHLFCYNCLRNHAEQMVFGQAKAQITCLEPQCEAPFSVQVLQSTLDKDWLDKLDERMREENINCADIENLIRCKYCNFAAVVDTPAEEDKVFKCPNVECAKEFCRLCQEDWELHIGRRCEELETTDETFLRKKIEEKMAEAVIRTCNACKAKIMKTEGCNKMTCRCGAKMCYICRAPNIGYEHFCRHPRNPGMKCDKCTHCSLWEDDKVVDKKALDEIQQEAQDVQSASGLRAAKIGIDEQATLSNDNQQAANNYVHVNGAGLNVGVLFNGVPVRPNNNYVHAAPGRHRNAAAAVHNVAQGREVRIAAQNAQRDIQNAMRDVRQAMDHIVRMNVAQGRQY